MVPSPSAETSTWLLGSQQRACKSCCSVCHSPSFASESTSQIWTVPSSYPSAKQVSAAFQLSARACCVSGFKVVTFCATLPRTISTAPSTETLANSPDRQDQAARCRDDPPADNCCPLPVSGEKADDHP